MAHLFRPLLLAAALAAACGRGRPAVYPDHGKVEAAHRRWCALLTELYGEGGKWSHRADCEAADPAGSAEFIALMIPCFRGRYEAEQGALPDSRSMISACTEQVLVELAPADPARNALVDARCRRMKVCEEVEPAECHAGVERLPSYHQALFTTMYNERAQDDIAECLLDAPCTKDEDRARSDCYQPLQDKRLWLPI
ncbi:MAG: hypothetical protein HY744_02195 [Deltaproteobacteria bacterium]|nr:hypothetical protein [Deltaproteobacteria bacterium]